MGVNEGFTGIDVDVILENCTITIVIPGSYLTKDQHSPSNLVLLYRTNNVCCCCLHIKSRSDLYSVLSNIRTGPTDANAFRGHRLTTQKGFIL